MPWPAGGCPSPPTRQGRGGLLACFLPSSGVGVSLPLRWRWCPAVRPALVAVWVSLISTAPRRQTQQEEEGQGSAGPPVAGRGAFNSRPQGIRGYALGGACGARVSAWPRGIGCGRPVGPDGQPTGTAPTAGACARDVRGERRGGSCAPHAGRHRTRERGGLSSGSQLTCTFFLRGIYLERGFQSFFLHRSALLLLMLALVELFRSLSVGFLFCFYIIILYSGCGTDFISFSKA